MRAARRLMSGAADMSIISCGVQVCGPWPLTTRGGRWPADPTLANDLGLIGAKPLRPGQPGATPPTPVPPRVLRRGAVASSKPTNHHRPGDALSPDRRRAISQGRRDLSRARTCLSGARYARRPVVAARSRAAR